ncbi:MAG: hypothetical protein IKM23_02520 [Bacteroidales bacterium]|nr:hypothetical protein [Bacteroidales bacterium]
MDEQKQLSIISKNNYEPKALSIAMREAGIDTVAKSVRSDVVSINRLVRELGYKETAALIVMQLTRLEMLLNVSKPMHPEAIAETATMVVDSCVTAGVGVNVADIDIIFKRALKGEYGKIYGGISCAEVLRWFNEYYMEKSEACVQWNIEKSSEYHYYSPRSSDIAQGRELEFHKAAADYYRDLMNKKK